MNQLLIFGFGYTCAALSKILPKSDWQITATSRTEDGANAIKQRGFAGYVFSDDIEPTDALINAISSATHILVSAPPSQNGDPVLASCKDAIQRADALSWLGYLSTIGVYGDHGGAWIDETTPATPSSARSKRRLAAEQAWQHLADTRNTPLQIFRLSGIYGPGRSAIDKVRSGSARCIIKPEQVFNRIHVADAARAIAAGMSGTAPGGVYNLADNLPAPPEDVLTYAADLLKAPHPPRIALEDADLSPMAQSFYSENKRVRSQRLSDGLGIELKFPTYREGLQAIFEDV